MNNDSTKRYVVLEHLQMPDRGFRFFSTNCRWSGRDPENPKENNTHSIDGELWYKEIGFADTVEEAQSMLSANTEAIPSMKEIQEYYDRGIL